MLPLLHRYSRLYNRQVLPYRRAPSRRVLAPNNQFVGEEGQQKRPQRVLFSLKSSTVSRVGRGESLLLRGDRLTERRNAESNTLRRTPSEGHRARPSVLTS